MTDLDLTLCPRCSRGLDSHDFCRDCGMTLQEASRFVRGLPPMDRRRVETTQPGANHSHAHSALVSAIRLALGQEPDLTLWPVQPGGIADATGRPMRCGPVGMADLVGILAPAGRWFALEAKTGAGKQRPQQIMWGNLIRKRGGFYAVVRSIEDAQAALARARLGMES